jgi:hypothetical protein
VLNELICLVDSEHWVFSEHQAEDILHHYLVYLENHEMVHASFVLVAKAFSSSP